MEEDGRRSPFRVPPASLHDSGSHGGGNAFSLIRPGQAAREALLAMTVMPGMADAVNRGHDTSLSGICFSAWYCQQGDAAGPAGAGQGQSVPWQR